MMSEIPLATPQGQGEVLSFQSAVEDNDGGDSRGNIHESKKAKTNYDFICPYLDTINRNVLDFDFQKMCSISLSVHNVYACLVCGKYFQGRNDKTHAFDHSIHENHHVFLNLSTKKFYCLPDNYEFFDESLEDIIYLLLPVYDRTLLEVLDSERVCRAFDGSTFNTGIIGINNIKANDYSNVILMALAHIRPLRDFFLLNPISKDMYSNRENNIVVTFGEFVRKIWNIHNFRSHVSPHEIMQAIMVSSNNKFSFIRQSESCEFLSWFLNNLNQSLKKINTLKKDKKLFSNTFQGKLKVTSQHSDNSSASKTTENITLSNFFLLPCDLEQTPLYPDNHKEKTIPQQSIYSLLNKYDGESVCQNKGSNGGIIEKRYKITKLPPYLIIVYKRFQKNYFLHEKISTIIDFPLK
ncbi:MAG: U4/U6.U5 tri-snRNP-associated protein 2, variant 2 [Marteilia pararefringens]